MPPPGSNGDLLLVSIIAPAKGWPLVNRLGSRRESRVGGGHCGGRCERGCSPSRPADAGSVARFGHGDAAVQRDNGAVRSEQGLGMFVLWQVSQ